MLYRVERKWVAWVANFDRQTEVAPTNAVLNFVKANLNGQVWIALVVSCNGGSVAMLVTRLVRGHKLFTLQRVTAVALVAFLLSSSVWWFQAGQAQASSTLPHDHCT